MITTKILNSYQNGNMKVTICEDGTKIQEWEGNCNPIYPVSMDIKITNYCNLGCKFCHEMSTINGKHGDLNYLYEIIKTLPAGTELAIGGGNPLEHPDLLPFLNSCKDLKLIPNLTINFKHLKDFDFLINELIGRKLIYGLGISISDDNNLEDIQLIEDLSNVVYHVIAGVNEVSILNKIRKSKVQKVLILGYKQVGRGINHYSSDTQRIIADWNNQINNYLHKIHLSFDNLSVKQLEINKHLSKREFDEFYMGDDGVCTMYIDAVKQEFAQSSTSIVRYPLIGNIIDIFNIIKNNK
jgi:organic radical activating enzyme